MAGGLGEAAAVLGLVSGVITLFDGCVKGFVLLSTASELGSKGDVLRCQLEWEHFRLNSWATTAGLFREPPELNVSYPQIVQATLANLEQLLGDAGKIKEQYGLGLVVTEEELSDLSAPARLFGRSLGKVKPQFVNNTAKVYSRRNNVWKKVRWASIDNAGLRLLLKDIRYFNKRLESLLHPVDQSLYETDSNAVMRSIVTRSHDKKSLDILSGPLDTVDSAIAASVRLKQKGFLLDLLGQTYDSPSESGATTPTGQEKLVSSIVSLVHRKHSPGKGMKSSSLQRDPKQLILKTRSALLSSREVATYASAPVIVEWKVIDRSHESRLKQRVANVATFLAEMDDPAFHSLSCCGYLKEPKSGRYAYLFRPPRIDSPTDDTVSSNFVMTSLDDLFVLSSLLPSLNQRVSIAVALAETVLQLHTAGWLHKSIRPDNVLFFKAGLEDWAISDGLPAAYLSGYEYARADNPLETSEDPSWPRYGELYRHPLSTGTGRASFNQRFDLYSLGCILIEICFWAPLQTILLQCVRSAALSRD
jgi:Prion-inhibition and propagation